ncbi:MAG: Zinc protease [Deltaproteobacteria bacterium]|nr:Zinc protease [Deltaproteobacteria bacterium]
MESVCLKKDERPPRGPFVYVCCFIFSLFFLTSLLFPGRVAAMETHTLKNGLNYILEERKNTGVVAIQVWMNVGSKDEDDKVAGITHFIEHLIFKGTDKIKGNDFAKKIEAMGGSVNAFTSFDNTVYHIVIPSMVFREGFELLMESVRNPAFPDQEIAKERKVVLEEIKMGEDDPQRKLFKELFSLSYHGEVYGKPVIGFTETVANITRDDILKYFRTHYVPSNQTIVITGDFDRDAAHDLITRDLSDQKGRKKEARKKIADSGSKGETEKIVYKDVRENYIALAYGIPKRTNPDVPAIDVLGTILGDGESSRLQEVLKKRKAIVNGISTYVFTPQEEGLFVVYANYSGDDTQSVLRGIEAEVRRLHTGDINEWELVKAKNMLKAYYIYDAEAAQGRARQIGDSMTMTGDPDFIDKFLKAVDKVTAADVKAAAGKYLTEKDRRTVIMGPKKVANPYRKNLKNGLQCLVNKNDSSPTFSVRIGFAGGLKAEESGRNGEFNILSRMLLKGTKNKTSSDIAKQIDMLAGSLAPYNGRNVFGLSGKFLSKDIKAVIPLIKELLVESSFTDEELTRVKREVMSEIRQRDDDPVSYTFMRFNKAMFADHPYSFDPIGTEKDVEKLSLGDIAGLYREYVTPDGAVLAFSGDVDEKEIFKLVEELLQEWKGKKTGLKRIYKKPSRQTVNVDKDIEQVHIVFGFPGPGLIDKDRYAAEVLDAALSGMGGRIHKALREENPYAYAVTFFNQMAYETGAMGIYIGTSPAFVKDVERIARREIQKMIDEGFSEQEIEDGKNYIIGNHYIRMQSNGAKASSMCLDSLYGLSPDLFKTFPGFVGKVTKEDVDRVARKFINPDWMVEVRVGRVGPDKKGGK